MSISSSFDSGSSPSNLVRMFKDFTNIQALEYLSHNKLKKETVISSPKYNLFKKFILKFLNSFIFNNKDINLKSKIFKLDDFNKWSNYYNKFYKIVNKLIYNHINSIKLYGFDFRGIQFNINELYILFCNYMNITSNYFDDELFLPPHLISNITANDRIIDCNTKIIHIWYHIFFKYQLNPPDYFDKTEKYNFYSDLSMLFIRLYIEQFKKILLYKRSSRLISRIISSKSKFNKDISQSIMNHINIDNFPQFTPSQIKDYVFTKRPSVVDIKKQINLHKFNKQLKIIQSPKKTINVRKYNSV
jgi:hypothetical protein